MTASDRLNTKPIFPLFGLNGDNGFVISGTDDEDFSSNSVSNAGDVNGDGIGDLIIGAPGTKKSYVVFGNDSGFARSLDLATLDGSNGFVINAITSSSYFFSDYLGRSVSSAGDINVDGFDDLIIANPAAGENYVVFGSSDEFPSSLDLSTLNGNNGFVINGIDLRNYSNSSVSNAGDVNGDGFDDLIIGSLSRDPSDSNGYYTYAGESYVIFGSDSGFDSNLDLSTLDGSNGFVINGIDNFGFDYSGWSVSSAGDVNGDGFDDLIIGAPSADPNGNSKAGESYVIFGSGGEFASNLDIATLDGSNGFVINSIDSSSFDYLGRSVSSAGDVNGDGFDDLVIGAPHADPNGKEEAGASYVIFGSGGEFASNFDLSTLNGRNGFVINGIDERGHFGTLLSSAGDLNGDGFDDLIVGAPGAREKYVIFGSGGEFASNFDLATLNNSNGFIIDGKGDSVSSAGDVNGDGFDDLIIGASYVDLKSNGGAGASYVIFGSDSGFAPVIGELIADQLSVTNRLFRLVINDNAFRDPDGDTLTYSATLADDSPLPSWLTFDPNTVTFSGTSLSKDIGDLEIKLTATDSSNKSTSTNFTLAVTNRVFPAVFEPQGYLTGGNGFVIKGSSYDRLGYSVSSSGDVNGDGFDDLIIAAKEKSYVIFGSSDRLADSLDLSTLNGGNGFVINGFDGHDYSVSSAGDVNGDGFDDLIIGVPNADPNSYTNAGKTYVVFGSSSEFASSLDLSTLDGSNGFGINGIDRFDKLGYSVSSAGDVNGDGFDDLIIGALGAKESYVVFGSSDEFASSLDLSTLDGSNGFGINGIDVSSKSLYSIDVSNAGDVNGDGFDDLIIAATGSYRFYVAGGDGAYEYTPGGQRAYVVFGTAKNFDSELNLSTLDRSNGFVINGIDDYQTSLDWSVSSAGDVNGDGFDDLIIGTFGTDPDGYSIGEKSYIVFGSSDGMPSSLDLSILDGSNGFVINGIDRHDDTGKSVSSAGDVNGDGFDDLIIGAPGADPNGNSRAGESYVIFGSGGEFASSLDLSTLDGSDGFVINGINQGDYLGDSVSNAGDVNGDGIADLIIGAPRAGESYVIYGIADSNSISDPNPAADNNLSGTSEADRIESGAGNDLARGSYGKDTIEGDTGEDLLFGEGGADLLDGGDGSDLLRGGSSGDRLLGGDGDDTLKGGVGNDTLEGNAGNDLLSGNRGRDRLSGGTGNDLLFGSNGKDTLDGDTGADHLLGERGADRLDGGAGNDLLQGGNNSDRLVGGSGDDSLFGDSGNDRLAGSSGNDSLFGGTGQDNLGGGTGNDLLFGSDGNDAIHGNDGRDRLFGDRGADRLNGGAGNDLLNGGVGSDRLLGGDGDDTVEGNAGNDLIFGNVGADEIIGNAGNDSLNGGIGDDTLVGGSGNDSLDGGSNNDLLIGIDPSDPDSDFGTGELDTLTGGANNDTFVLADENRIFYDDGDNFTAGDEDLALIVSFDSERDTIQLQGTAEFYSLDFFTNSAGTIDAKLIYDPSGSATGETIALLEDVDSNLSIDDSAFTFI